MDTLFERQLRDRIELTRDMKISDITENKLDRDDYMYGLGYLEALRRVGQLMDEINDRDNE